MFYAIETCIITDRRSKEHTRYTHLNFLPFCWVLMGELIGAENDIRIGNLYIHRHVHTKRKHRLECNGQSSLGQGIFRKNASCCVSKEWQ